MIDYHKIWLGAAACSDPWHLSDDLTWSWCVQWSTKPAPSSIGWSDMELLCKVISKSNPFVYEKKIGAGAYSDRWDWPLHLSDNLNRLFYSCWLSTLAFKWLWGWQGPCFDTNLLCFIMEIVLEKCYSVFSIRITWFTYSKKVCIKTRSPSASISSITVKWPLGVVRPVRTTQRCRSAAAVHFYGCTALKRL